MHRAENTVGGEATKLASPSELDRTYLMLADQSELLNTLGARLAPVSSSVPSDPGRDSADSKPHISHVADTISNHNEKLRQIIKELTI